MSARNQSSAVRMVGIVGALLVLVWALVVAWSSGPEQGGRTGRARERVAGPVARNAVAGVSAVEDVADGPGAVLPAGAVEIAGQVEDLTGGPIEDAVVRAGPWAARSDGEGRFVLSVPPKVAALDVEADGYVPVHHDLVLPSPPLRFRLVPAATIEGHVQLAEGGRVAGAVVSAGGRRTTAAEDGTFRLTGLLPGRYEVTASAPGLRTRAAGRVAVGVAEVRSGVAVVLVPAATAIVRLLDSHGGAACRAGTLTFASEVRSATGAVSADGVARIDGLAPGPYLPQLSCSDPVYTWQGAPVEIAEVAAMERSIVVASGTEVRACVAGDVPASGAVDLDDAAGTRHVAELDGERCVTFRRIPPGPARVGPTLLGGLDGWADAVTTEVGADPLTVELPSRPVGAVEGRVSGAEGVAGLHVLLASGGARAGVGPDGTFRLDGVPAGTVRLEVRDAEGLRRALVGEPTVEVEAGRTATVELTLAASDGVLEGRVLDADGGPAADVFVTVVDADDDSFQTWLVADRVTGSAGGRTALTDPDGTFEVSGVGLGPVRVVATDRRGITARTGPVDPGAVVTVRLPAPGRIAGAVRGTGGGWTVRVRGGDTTMVDRYEGDAAFDLEPVPVPGSYDVEVIADDGRSVRTHVVLSAAVPEVTVDLELEAPRRIRGRVVGADGRPRPGAWIAGTLTDADGRFEATVPAGEATVLLWDRPGGGLPRRVPLPPGEGDLDLGDVHAGT